MSITKKQKRQRRGEFSGAVYSIIIYSILYIPVFVMMMFSFNNQRYNYYWNGFTTMWYSKLFSNSALTESLWYSVVIAVLATVISVTIGTIGALGLKKYEFRGKKFINEMLYIPIIVPEIVMAVALLIIFIKTGLALGMGSILIGHCTFCIPYAVVTIRGRISGDDYTLEEASMDLGANRIQTFINVTLPGIMPGVMSAAFLSFTLSIDDVVMSNMLAGAKNSTLPVLILSMNKSGVTPDVNALTTIMILIIVIAMILNNLIKNALKKRKKNGGSNMKKLISIVLTLVLIVGLFTGCGGTNTGSGESGKAAQSTELNIYMWQQYISDDLIANFEEENNAKVNLSYMSDNADAITKLTAGGGQEYDLIMTCDAYMESLVDGGYIEKINFDNVPNASNINESYWTAKEYCVPYLMNYIYVVYNKDTSPIEIKSYNDLINPALKGHIATIDGARNLFPIALVALGYDPNSTNESEIAEAYEWLVKYNDNVVAYGNAEQNLTNGTASVAFTYDGNASWAMSELGDKNNLVIADFEKDPVQLGFDLYVIPKGAKHVDLAEKFLNYITEPKVMAANLVEYPYSCPNDVAVEAASDDYKNDPARDFAYKENVFFQKDVGEAIIIYNDYYQKLKVGE